MNIRSIVSWLVLLTLLAPAAAPAGAKKQADRELARQLSASLVLVAKNGRAFAEGRDALARTRLFNIQTLEESLIRVQEANALDVRAWKVIGETYRVGLLEGVLDATAEIASQQAAKVARRAQQQADLAATRSAVSRNSSQLVAAAGSLAAMAEPPKSGKALSALLQTSLIEFAESLAEESAKLNED